MLYSLCTIALFAGSALSALAPADGHGVVSLSGVVLRADRSPVAGALVLVFDQKSGVPVERGTSRPFTEGPGREPSDLTRATTDGLGRFAIHDLDPGVYRVLAQSWPGSDTSIDDPLAVLGKTIELHGTADHLTVPSDKAKRIELRPAGSASLVIEQGFGNDETLLLISTAPQIADPILSFWSWGDAHLNHLIGYNRMPRGATEIRGLPGEMVYLSVFAADNSPGFGAIAVDLAMPPGSAIKADVVAGWSDARHTPPDRLKPLFDDIVAGKIAIEPLLGLEPGQIDKFKSPTEAFKVLGALDREVVLPDGRKVTVGDVLACRAYVDLNKRTEKK